MRDYLDKNYGYDAGHSLTGAGLGLLLWSLGAPAFWAALLGGLIYAVPKEIYDMVIERHWPKLDNWSDLVSYQVSWPAVYFAALAPGLALALLACVAVVYLSLIAWKVR